MNDEAPPPKDSHRKIAAFLFRGLNVYRIQRGDIPEADVVLALCDMLVTEMSMCPDAAQRKAQREVTLRYLNGMLDSIEASPELARIHAKQVAEQGG